MFSNLPKLTGCRERNEGIPCLEMRQSVSDLADTMLHLGQQTDKRRGVLVIVG